MRKMRCKMLAGRVSSHDDGKGKTYDVRLTALYSNKEGSENKKYWASTPCGSVELVGLKNAPEIEPGKEYYVDLILVE